LETFGVLLLSVIRKARETMDKRKRRVKILGFTGILVMVVWLMGLVTQAKFANDCRTIRKCDHAVKLDRPFSFYGISRAAVLDGCYFAAFKDS
jgi:hypothetical protein